MVTVFRRFFVFLALCLVSMSAYPATSEAAFTSVAVSAAGKDLATAELNAKVAAVRTILQQRAEPDFLKKHAEAVRSRFILASGTYTGQVQVSSSRTENTLTYIDAVVEVDADKICQTLLEIDPGAVKEGAAGPASEPAADEAEPDSESEPETAEDTAVPDSESTSEPAVDAEDVDVAEPETAEDAATSDSESTPEPAEDVAEPDTK